MKTFILFTMQILQRRNIRRIRNMQANSHTAPSIKRFEDKTRIEEKTANVHSFIRQETAFAYNVLFSISFFFWFSLFYVIHTHCTSTVTAPINTAETKRFLCAFRKRTITRPYHHYSFINPKMGIFIIGIITIFFSFHSLKSRYFCCYFGLVFFSFIQCRCLCPTHSLVSIKRINQVYHRVKWNCVLNFIGPTKTGKKTSPT